MPRILGFMHQSACGRNVSLLQCHGGAKSSAVEMNPTKCQCELYADCAKQPFTCWDYCC